MANNNDYVLIFPNIWCSQELDDHVISTVPHTYIQSTNQKLVQRKGRTSEGVQSVKCVQCMWLSPRRAYGPQAVPGVALSTEP